jgi:hypothetical protein
MRDADLLGRLPIDKVLTHGYFRQVSWKSETGALRKFLSSLSRCERVTVFHRAIDAWKQNSFAGKWATAEFALAQEEALLLQNFPNSETAKNLKAGRRVPL